MIEVIDPPEMLECFGIACQTCKAFTYCPMNGEDNG